MIPYAATIIALVGYNLRKRAKIRERTRKFQEQQINELKTAQAE